MTFVRRHPDEVVAVINELHAVAEIVRTYGDLGLNNDAPPTPRTPGVSQRDLPCSAPPSDPRSTLIDAR